MNISRRMRMWMRLWVGCWVAFCAGVLAAAPAGAVVNGKPVATGQFDYVANIEIFGMKECSGVLLAPSWVLTAGHCTSVSGALSEGLAPSPVTFPAAAFTVYLGTPDANGAGGEKHTVAQVLIDPHFLVSNGDGNDVTLLHLSTPSAQPTIQIAPNEPSLWKAGVLGTVAGFGTTSESSSVKPPTMRYAQVPFVTDDDCASVYPFGTDIVADDGWYDPFSMVCAGYPQGGTDVCEGDSGGPILVTDAAGAVELVGTTSFGHGCAEPGYPTTYTLAAGGNVRPFIAQYVPSAFAPATAADGPPRTAGPVRPKTTAKQKETSNRDTTAAKQQQQPTTKHRSR